MELIRNQKPGGHEEDRASFTNQSQYKVSRTIALKSTPMKGRRRTGRRKRRRQGEGVACLGARQRERGEGVFMVPTQGSKIPLDLN